MNYCSQYLCARVLWCQLSNILMPNSIEINCESSLLCALLEERHLWRCCRCRQQRVKQFTRFRTELQWEKNTDRQTWGGSYMWSQGKYCAGASRVGDGSCTMTSPLHVTAQSACLDGWSPRPLDSQHDSLNKDSCKDHRNILKSHSPSVMQKKILGTTLH